MIGGDLHILCGETVDQAKFIGKEKGKNHFKCHFRILWVLSVGGISHLELSGGKDTLECQKTMASI